MTQLTAGQQAPDFTCLDLDGQPHRLADYAGRPVLLSFYRYASCPLCNLRVHHLIERHPELAAGELVILALFQSSQEVIGRNVGRQRAPFPILADPDRQIYDRYGVEIGVGGLLRGAVRAGDLWSAMRQGFMPGEVDAPMASLPADFLIGPDQRIHAAYYGRDPGDHLPFEQIEAFARGWRAAGSAP